MLVDEPRTGYELTGYLVADPTQAGFAIPVFRGGSSNRPLLQVVGPDDRVVGFNELADTRRLRDHSDPTIMIAEGQPALWAFAEADGALTVGRRASLTAELASTVDARDDPFLQLQIVQFCGMARELTARWKATFAYMYVASPRSAAAWRDVVVVPAGARAAIAAAADAHGLGNLLEDPARTVAVRVIEDRTVITLAGKLHDALLGTPAAVRAMRSGTLAQRRAFGLRPDVIARAHEPPTQSPSKEAQGAQLIAIGELALRIVTHNASPGRSLNGSIRKAPPSDRQAPPIHVVDARTYQAVNERVRSDRPDPAEDATLFVLLEVSATDPDPVPIALDLCRMHSGGRRRTVAVVPHLPADLMDEREVELWWELAEAFDAVWALSDLSPHTRQSLSFGGGRSLAAAARRLDQLLVLAEQDAFPLVARSSTSRRVSVLGTAVGGLSPRGLLQHAVTKVAAASLELTHSDLLVAGAGPDAPSPDWLARVVGPVAPGTPVHPIRLPDEVGAQTAILACAGVPLIPVDRRRLKSHCLDQLRLNGWDVSGSGGGTVFIDALDWHIALPSTTLPSTDAIVEGWSPDDRHLRLTVQPVGRRDFVAGVLFDAVPVTLGRIPFLDRIVAGRWRTVVGIMRDRRFEADDLLVAAVLARADRSGAARAGRRRSGMGFGLSGRPRIVVHHDCLTIEMSLGRPGVPDLALSGRLDADGLHVTFDPRPT